MKLNKLLSNLEHRAIRIEELEDSMLVAFEDYKDRIITFKEYKERIEEIEQELRQLNYYNGFNYDDDYYNYYED